MQELLKAQESRQRALKILESIAPEYAPKAVFRTEHLLPTPREGAVFGDTFDDLGEGWAFIIGAYFLDALDTKLTGRVNPNTKKKELVWTQGSNFCFPEGYTFHSSPGFPKLALQVSKSFAAEAATYKYTQYKEEPFDLPEADEEAGLRVVKKFRPRATVKKWESIVQTRRYKGIVEASLYIPGAVKSWDFSRTLYTTQDGLVRMLITGEICKEATNA